MFNGWKQFYSNSVADVYEVDKASAYIRQDISFVAEENMEEVLRRSGFGEIHDFFKTFLCSGWFCRKQD